MNAKMNGVQLINEDVVKFGPAATTAGTLPCYGDHCRRQPLRSYRPVGVILVLVDMTISLTTKLGMRSGHIFRSWG